MKLAQGIKKVVVCLDLMGTKHTLGALAYKDGCCYFSYDVSFLEKKLDISPLLLPKQTGLQVPFEGGIDGLFGVFNDSLPDGWGRLLVDRKIRQQNQNPAFLTPLDRLAYVGVSGMGALTYAPEHEWGNCYQPIDLDSISQYALAFFDENDDLYLDQLLSLNGSSAGVRPKIMMTMNGEDWLVKFPSYSDPVDIGPIEYAYHLMAKEAGLKLPEARLMPSKTSSPYFSVKRFDRTSLGRLHVHTISGLLHADHRLPSLDYSTILSATQSLTQNKLELEKQFKAAVFNLLSHNRDDHAKNFSFCMDEEGVWTVAPAYDLTHSSGPSGEHCTMFMGEGKCPTRLHVMQLAKESGLSEEETNEMIQRVKSAVAQWSKWADEAGVTPQSKNIIQKDLNQVQSYYS